MEISQKGIDFIKGFEALRLEAYQDEAGIWTCGWGSTGHDITSGTTFTEEEAQARLESDLVRFVAHVNAFVTVQLTQNQFDALVSFDFNTGHLHGSTLLDKLNSGDLEGAANEFPRWCHSGGHISNGLVRRRAAEKALFETPDEPAEVELS